MSIYIIAAMSVFLSATSLWAKADERTLRCLLEANPEWRFTPVEVGAEPVREYIEVNREVHGSHINNLQAPVIDWDACGLMPAEISFAEVLATPVTYHSELSDQVLEVVVPYSETWFVTIEPFNSERNRAYEFLRALGLEISMMEESKSLNFTWAKDGSVEVEYWSPISEAGVQECDRWNYQMFLHTAQSGVVKVGGVNYELTYLQATHALNSVYGVALRGAHTTITPCSFSVAFKPLD